MCSDILRQGNCWSRTKGKAGPFMLIHEGHWLDWASGIMGFWSASALSDLASIDNKNDRHPSNIDL